MSIPTVSLDETTPAGSEYIRDGDNRIREYKTQNREIMEVDHKYESSGQDADMGKHSQVSLIEAADIGTGAEGLPILGAQTADGKAELCFTDEDDNDVQMTKSGHINYEEVQNVSDEAKAAIIAWLYPVGSIYISTLSTNPGTLLGTGTWAAFGAGKVLVGLNAADSDFNEAEETGGAKTHTLTSDEVPATTVDIVGRESGSSGSACVAAHTVNDGTPHTIEDAGTVQGGAGAHNNLQPYIVVYMWKRTA